MRLAGAHLTVRRIWTVELRSRAGGPRLVCPHCTVHSPPLQAASARSAVLAHLARHAHADALPAHLRTCQCRAQGCSWHLRHRGCAGPVLLTLTRDRSGRTWRLSDTCAACAAATSHTAVVPATLLAPQRSGCASRRPKPLGGPAERTRVREMLTYLAAALPSISSPAARLLALQCALRADPRGTASLPTGLLRGMRLHRRGEVWRELARDGWLEPPGPPAARTRVRLLDPAVLDQAPGQGARRRAAHWALRPGHLTPPADSGGGERLTALVLAVHTGASGSEAEMDVVVRLCGHSLHQTADLLDRLVTLRLLSSWQHRRETDEVVWEWAVKLPAAGHRSAAVPNP